MCSFSRSGQKIKNYSSLKFLPENLRNFHSTERLSCASRGIDNFSLAQLHESRVMESSRLAELKYAFFSRTRRKIEKLRRSNVFPSTIFKHGLLEGSTFLLQYSYKSHTLLESFQLGELKYAISAGQDVRPKVQKLTLHDERIWSLYCEQVWTGLNKSELV